METLEYITTLEEHNNGVISAVFSNDGSLLASGSDDKTIKIWNTETWKCFATFPGHSDRVNAVAFNHSGTDLVSGSRDCSIIIWDVIEKRIKLKLQEHKKSVLCIDVDIM